MLTATDLKPYRVLENLDETEREKLVPLCKTVHFDEGTRVYREGENAEAFFLVKNGTVLLEQRINPTMTVTIGTLKSGGAFGLTAILDQTAYSMDAVAATDCDLLMIDAGAILDLLKQEPVIGYKTMRATVTILKERLAQRTRQFARSLATHPDIHELDA